MFASPCTRSLRWFVAVLAVGVSLLAAAPAWAAFGQPDTTFGPTNTGSVTVQVGSCTVFGAEGAYATAIMPDGRIVAAGDACSPSGGVEIVIERLTPNGLRDTTYGNGAGYVVRDIAAAGQWAQAYAVVVDAAGDPCAAGFANTSSGQAAIVCTDPAGNPLPGFGTAGVALFSIPGSWAEINHLLIAPPGAPGAGDLIAGIDSQGHYSVASINFSTGALDTTFGPNHTGIAQTAVAPSSSTDAGVQLQTACGGGFYVAGDGAGGFLTVQKLTAGGLADTSFGGAGDGTVQTVIGPSDEVARGLLVENSSGPNACEVEYAGLSASTGFTAGRLTSTGASVGGGSAVVERALEPASAGCDPAYLTMLEPPDGSGNTVVVSHAKCADGSYSFSIVQLVPSLQPHTSYGTGGRVITFTTGASGTNGLNTGSVFDSQGRLVAAFYATQAGTGGSTTFSLVVERFVDYGLNSGLPPNSSPQDPACANPVITSIAPGNAAAGDLVGLVGTDFGSTADSADAVRFGSVLAQVQSWSQTLIVVWAPPGASGPVTVTCGALTAPISSGNTPGGAAPPRFTLDPTPPARPVAQGVCVPSPGGTETLTSLAVDGNEGGRLPSTTWTLPASGRGKRRTPARVIGRRPSIHYQFRGKGRSFAAQLTVTNAYRLTATAMVRCSVMPAAPRKHRKAPHVTPPPVTIVVPSDTMFAFDSSVVAASARRYLTTTVQRLLAGARTVSIQGNTDNVGPADYNLALGLRRAQAVRALVRIPRGARLSVVSYGLTRPVASNATASGRQRNRRVVLRIAY